MRKLVLLLFIIFFCLGAKAQTYDSTRWSSVTLTGTFTTPTQAITEFTPSDADTTIGSGYIRLTGWESGVPTIDSMLLTFTSLSNVFAGANNSITAGGTYTIADATAVNVSTLAWSSSGSGTFSNPAILSPVYTPSVTDTIVGTVTLTLTGISLCNTDIDQMTLTINRVVPFNPTTYYIAPSGNDANNGTSTATPFQTIQALVNLMGSNGLIAGDSVLFQRGGRYDIESMFTMSIVNNWEAPTVIADYGTGKKPILSGFDTITLSETTGQIWSVYKPWTESNRVKILRIDGVPQIKGTYPKRDFNDDDWVFSGLSTTGNQGATSTTFTIPALTEGADYWNGCQLLTEKYEYEWDLGLITDFASTVITVAEGTVLNESHSWITSGRQVLTVNGEWAHQANDSILIYDDGNLATKVVEISSDHSLINLSSSVDHLKFQNLIFEGTGSYVFYKSTSAVGDSLIVDSCDFRQCDYGSQIRDINNIVINNCTFTTMISAGLSITENNRHTRVENCTFYDIGDTYWEEILGVRGHAIYYTTFPPYPGFNAGGDFKYNTFKRTAHRGMSWNKRGDVNVQYNLFDTCLTVFRDAGTIYSYTDADSTVTDTISHNIIRHAPHAMGIYMDDEAWRANIYNNTIIGCEYGIFMHNNSYPDTVKNNWIYGTKPFESCLRIMENGGFTVDSLYVHDNIYIISNDYDTMGMVVPYFIDWDEIFDWDNNYFVNVFNANKPILVGNNVGTSYTPSEFCSLYSLECNSSEAPIKVDTADIAADSVIVFTTNDTLNYTYQYDFTGDGYDYVDLNGNAVTFPRSILAYESDVIFRYKARVHYIPDTATLFASSPYTNADTVRIQVTDFPVADSFRIVYKIGSYPTSRTDGTLALAFNYTDTASYNDTIFPVSITQDTTMYVAMFAGSEYDDWQTIPNKDTARITHATVDLLTGLVMEYNMSFQDNIDSIEFNTLDSIVSIVSNVLTVQNGSRFEVGNAIRLTDSVVGTIFTIIDITSNDLTLNSAPSGSANDTVFIATIPIIKDTVGSYNVVNTTIALRPFVKWHGTDTITASYDGIDDFLTASTGIITSDPWSFSAWIKWEGTTGSHDAFAGYVNSTNIGVRYNNLNNYFIRNSSSQNVLSTVSSVPVYQTGWHHVVYTGDGSNLRVYVDGVLIETISGVTNMRFRRLGAGGIAGYYFNGDVDDIKVYSSEININQVNELKTLSRFNQ